MQGEVKDKMRASLTKIKSSFQSLKLKESPELYIIEQKEIT